MRPAQELRSVDICTRCSLLYVQLVQKNKSRTKLLRSVRDKLYYINRQVSELGVSEAVDERIDLSAALAERAFICGIAVVAREIRCGEERFDLDPLHLVNRGEDRADRDKLAAVILQAVDGAGDALAGRGGADEQQHLLVPDLLLCIVAEDHLVDGIELRRNQVDVAVQVDAALGERIREERAEDLGAFKADYCFYMC